MSLKKTEESIDLSGLKYRHYGQEETENFRLVREDYSSQVRLVLANLVKEPDLMIVKGVDYGVLVSLLKDAEDLQEAETWLEKKWKAIQDTKRDKLSQVKEQMDRVAEVARVQAQAEPKIASIFADFMDYRGLPAKKAAATKKKKAQAKEKTDE